MAHSKCARRAQADLDEIQAPTVNLSPELCDGEDDDGDGPSDDSFDTAEGSDFLKRLAVWEPPPPVVIPAPDIDGLDPDGLLSQEQRDEAATLLGYDTPASVAEAVGLIGRSLGRDHDQAARAWAKGLDKEQFRFLSIGYDLECESAFEMKPNPDWPDTLERMHTTLSCLLWTLEATGRDVEFQRQSLISLEERIANPSGRVF